MTSRGDRYVAPGQPPDAILETREQLRLLWACAGQLRGEWRLALLLNPPSVSEPRRGEPGADELRDSSPVSRSTGRSTSRGELDVFPANQIASIAEIGRALELTAEQYRLLFAKLGIPWEQTLEELAGRSPFYAVWRHLPLADKTIGMLIGKTGMQVLGLRKLAIRQVAGCMAAKKQPVGAHMSTVQPSA